MKTRISITVPDRLSVDAIVELALEALDSTAVRIDRVIPSRGDGIADAIVVLNDPDDIPTALKILEQAGIHVAH